MQAGQSSEKSWLIIYSVWEMRNSIRPVVVSLSQTDNSGLNLFASKHVDFDAEKIHGATHGTPSGAASGTLVFLLKY